MKGIPLNAEVEASDGRAGKSSHVIFNPVSNELTHFVVAHKHGDETTERIVPVEAVVETTHNSIRLSLTNDQVAELDPFTETHYIKVEAPDYDYARAMPYHALPTKEYDKAVKDEMVPPGELAVHRGAKVEASDGPVGQVDGFLVDPESGHISHMVLQEGHSIGDKVVSLPMSAIESVHRDMVFLKLSQKDIELLPAIPVPPDYDLGEPTHYELAAKVFDGVDGAEQALESLREEAKDRFVIHDAAVLVKDQDGQTSIKETGDVGARQGRLLGAIGGGLVGLLAGPVGAIVGALAGAGAGGLAAKRIDMGFSDKFLKNLEQYLQPGTSALIVLVEFESAQQLAEALADREGVLLRQTLTDELVKDLLEQDGDQQ